MINDQTWRIFPGSLEDLEKLSGRKYELVLDGSGNPIRQGANSLHIADYIGTALDSARERVLTIIEPQGWAGTVHTSENVVAFSGPSMRYSAHVEGFAVKEVKSGEEP